LSKMDKRQVSLKDEQFHLVAGDTVFDFFRNKSIEQGLQVSQSTKNQS